MKKLLASLFIVFLFCTCTQAASVGTSLERTIEDGVIVTCEDVTQSPDAVYVNYMVLSEEDLVVKVSEVGDLFDDGGGRLRPSGITIGGDDGYEREIIGGIKTKIRVQYLAVSNYELTEKYARATITINDQQLTFRNIPSGAPLSDSQDDSVKAFEYAEDDPLRALSARSVESFVYVTARVDDLGGKLKSIFSQDNVNMVVSLMPPQEVQQFRMVAAMASQIPAKSVAFVLSAEMGNPPIPSFQLVISIPDIYKPELERIAKGEARPIDIVALIMGRAGMPFAAGINVTVRQGAKGPYYEVEVERESIVISARGGFLLMALSPSDLEASIDSIEDAEKRLTIKRRFGTPDYCFVNLDLLTLIAFAESQGGYAKRKVGHFFVG